MSDDIQRVDDRTHIEELSLEEEMRTSYLNYSMSVIVSRALPDVRDGLKPSQRRILVAMNDLGIGPRAKYRKCAKIVGETMGNYHPHGDGAIYPTLVRMGQDFSSRYCLVDPQGNFGSIDGDPPAAMRYTEARMAMMTTYMLEDIRQNTVDYVPNFDESTTEPVVLPGKFPNLLCNGASGIAVGMATNIPPHNLREIGRGIIAMIENPDITLQRLMEVIPGPDFPTGGMICGRKGIQEAYATGRGSIVVRARCVTETTKSGRKSIVVTEIPYQLNKTTLIERIVDLVKTEQIKGISDIRDESDKEGMRLVIELKKGEEEEVILNQLFKYSQLQSTYSMILIALVNRKPQTLSLRQLLQCYIDHRRVVIQRRTRFLLDKALARAHILEGLRVALANIDEVIALIKKSPDAAMANAALMKKFSLTRRQAEAILHMRLQTLTGLEMEKIEKEYGELMEEIENYKAILQDDGLVLDIIREDVHEIMEKHGDERRTQIVNAAEDIDIEDLIAEEDVVVTVSHAMYIKRQPLATYRRQGRGGRGIIGAGSKEGDFVEHLFIASTHDYILFFTDKGIVHWLKVYDVPAMGRTARGRAIVNVFSLKNETITSMIPVREFTEDKNLIMATERGIVKKTVLTAYGRPQRGGIRAIKLDEQDKLVGVALTSGEDEIILGTERGYAIRFPEKAVRNMGRVTRGVGGITLRQDDVVKGMIIVEPKQTILTACENGYGKRTPFTDYRVTNRNGKGIINIQTSDRNGKVIGLLSVSDDDELMLMSASGMVTRSAVKDISVIGRNTQGVRLINLKEHDRLMVVARVLGGSAEKAEEDWNDSP